MHCRLLFDITWPRLLWAAFGPEAPTAAPLALPLPPGIRAVTGLSVRTLFDAILSVADLGDSGPVLMSGVNIQNMADIVRLHGRDIAAVDIAPATLLPTGEDLLHVQARSGARMAVIAHLFGTRSPVEGAARLRDRGVLVIHDLAQSFSRDAFSREALSAPFDGDVALFSFGPIKRRTALGGAVALFRDPALAARVRARLDAHPVLPGQWFRRRARKYLLLKVLSQPLPYGLVFALAAASGGDPDATLARLARGFSGDDLLAGIRHRPPARLLALMSKQLADDGGLAQRQRICEDFLGGMPATARLGAEARSNVHWLVPVRAGDPAALIERLRRHGFDATRGATSLRALTPGSEACQAIMDHIVYLPHPADMNEKTRARLKAAVTLD